MFTYSFIQLQVQRFFQYILDQFFPKYCYGCRTVGKYLCKVCIKEKLNLNWTQRCHICQNEIYSGFVHKECRKYSYLDGVIYLFSYEGIIKKLILDAKYKLNFSILNELGEIMAKFFKLKRIDSDFIVTSVPLHTSKKRFRGFNQSEVLAKSIALELNKTYVELLKRNKYTKTQVGLSRDKRKFNLKGIFEIRIDVVNGKGSLAKPSNDFNKEGVLLVDDVYTTGTTLNECAKVLKENGFKRVYGFVLAKSIS